MAVRQFDVILFGATGFTGGLVAEYLAAAARREQVRWAIAGRDAHKLQLVFERLSRLDDVVLPEVLQASVEDADSLARLAGAGRVVITTVGPYQHYGEPLLRACAEAGTHYVDLTGEPLFVEAMRERYDAQARLSGARIVNSCGFEAIPPDIGVLYTLRELRRRLGEAAWAGAEVKVLGGVEAGGGFSGGTWHSAVEAMSQAPRWWLNRPKPGRDHVHNLKTGAHREPRLERWALPMPTIDPEVVRHSARLRRDYGADFSYGHFYLSKKLLPLAAGVAGLAGIFTLAQFGPTRRWLLDRKQPGEGPSAEARERGWFRLSFVAEAGGQALVTRVSGGDPGYGATAHMLAEAALCLALDPDLPEAAGVITPAAAMGEALIPRLERAGIRFEVVA